MYMSCPLVGKSETPTEKFRAVLAQLEYTWVVNDWHRCGVPFKEHLYVPEKHPSTGFLFHEREDEAHVFKVLNVYTYMYMYMHTHACTCTFVYNYMYMPVHIF